MEGKYSAEGKQNGEWKEYYEDGKIKAIYNSKEGKLDGKQMAYDKDGKVVEELFYNNGVKQ